MSETPKHTVLVIDDEENIRRILVAMLQAEGYVVVAAPGLDEARRVLREQSVTVVLSDLRLEREEGIELLPWLREVGLNVPVILLTAHGTIDSAVDAMKQGAFDYLSKPFERAELARVIRKAILTYQFQSREPKVTAGSAWSIVGRNDKILKLANLVDKVAPTDATVLITGESGTGKELVAQALHEKSPRGMANGPFIKINCAAIPETLLESELFGHERGAFTGAFTAKPGRFELADRGTLFLDEIGEMSLEMQVKMLRVLQERTFERVGGLRTIRVDVRLVTATNRDLETSVKEGRFRADLFYRLNVVPIHLPALRERPDDIPLLAAYFLHKHCERLRKTPPAINPECLELLAQFPWPGNIRQLENVIERLSVITEGATLMPEMLPEEILEFEEQRFIDETRRGSLKEQVREVTRRIEKKAIEEALAETGSNVTQAARKLNLSRKGLQLKMKELGIR